MEILNILEVTRNDQTIVLILLSLATFRVYMEVIGADLCRLPITKFLAKSRGEQHLRKFHRMGFYFSMGYILLFAPPLLF